MDNHNTIRHNTIQYNNIQYLQYNTMRHNNIQYSTIQYYTSSLCLLRSLDRRELFVSRTRTTMAMFRSFSVNAPSLWNRLPPSARASLLSSNLSTSLSLLKTCLFSWS